MWRGNDAQMELGVRRAGRTGLAGPIKLRSATGYLNFAGLKGPTDVRLDQDALTLTSSADVLIVVENRQAAETVSDRFSDHAIPWTQGMMGPDSLAALDQLIADRERVLVFPDADLGGVRIAQQVLRIAPGAEIIDIGTYPHQPRKPFAADSVSEIGLKAAARQRPGHPGVNRQRLSLVAGEAFQVDLRQRLRASGIQGAGRTMVGQAAALPAVAPLEDRDPRTDGHALGRRAEHVLWDERGLHVLRHTRPAAVLH